MLSPVTGFWLAHLEGITLTTGWLALALALYVLVGACWLPVVWRVRRFAAAAVRELRPLVVHSGMASLYRNYRDVLPNGPEAVLRLKPDRPGRRRHRIWTRPLIPCSDKADSEGDSRIG